MMRSQLRRAPVWLAGGVALVLLGACQRAGSSEEQLKVAQAFDSWKAAILDHHADEAMAYIPHHVDDYLSTLDAPQALATAKPTPSQNPGVDLLLRRALEEKVPPDLRARLTMTTLLQRIDDRHLFNPRDLREITLGPVSVEGNRASAEVYYDGVLTAVRLPFLKEDDAWKIDVLSILPYAETLMRLDRELKGETEERQVSELVSKLPSL
ncbi:MAG TPA: hypothetical protein VHY09_08870 [Candidatus Methylacidiphilales bacterium]|jgi:hypothetical protein|nr:hypothetical protein [Candidatus Methylacidiphilales bacterium]